MSVNPDLLRGTLSTLLLETVAGQPRYGYEICKLVEQKTAGYFQMREGSLYPALHRMERAGLLRSTWRDAVEGRRRKYYQLTAKGKKELTARKAQWRDFAAAVNAVLSPRAQTRIAINTALASGFAVSQITPIRTSREHKRPAYTAKR